MIDTIYQDGTDQAIRDRLQRPIAPPPETPGAFAGFWRAAGGVPAGVAAGAGSVADLSGGVAALDASQGLVWNPGTRSYTQLPVDDSARKLQEKIALHGVDSLFTTEAGETFRTVAKDYMPDPQTTGAATQVTAGLLQFAAQAIPTAAAGGPVMGPAGVGVLAGMQESDRLREQGVDASTREAAGLAAGLGGALSMAIPMTGSTALIRALKGAGGGIATTSGQAEAERLILEHAGYDKLGDQYDPFDPVTLVLGGLVPAAFGAAFGHAAPARRPLAEIVQGLESRGQRYSADGKLLTSRTGAEGEMQVEPATQLDPGFGVTPAKDHSPEEIARVGHDYLAAMEKRYPGEPDKALAAYNAGPGRLDAAIKAHGDAWLVHMPDETQKYVRAGLSELGASPADPELVAAARVRQTAEAVDRSNLAPPEDLAAADAHTRVVETAADQMARGEPVSVEALVRPEESPASPFAEGEVEIQQGRKNVLVPGLRAEFDNGGGGKGVMELAIRDGRMYPAWVDAGLFGEQTTGGRVRQLYEHAIDEAAKRGLDFTSDDSVTEGAQRVYDALARRGYGVELNPAARDAVAPDVVTPRKLTDDGSPVYRVTSRPVDRPAAAARALGDLRAARVPADVAAPAGAGRQAFEAARDAETRGGGAPPRERTADGGGERAGEIPSAGPDDASAPAGAPRPGPEPSKLQQAVEAIAADSPDLMVQLDGMEHAVSIGDLLATVREAADGEIRDAGLLEVAAQCFISN
jgi:hypothetical protein